MAGCQTLRMAKPFSVVDVLPDNDSMYVKIPVKENRDLCHTIINNYISGLTEKNSAELLDRSEVFYASVNFETNAVNAAIVGDFPFFINMIFSEENGWKTLSYNESGYSCKYFISDIGFQISILENKVMLVSSSDVRALLRRQFEYDSSPASLEVAPAASDSTVYSKSEILSQAGENISFYTSKAGDFIESIVGNGITLAADTASGSFSKNDQNIYMLDMKMNFVNKHAVKPALFLFKKVQSDGTVTTEQLAENAISCTGMNMDIKTIVTLLIGG
ncbi:MAG: hypothetical protein K5930_06295 [Treponemataceae bacterium]|nr:hypothetical protein [Treponemataceae bacterium]